MVRLLKLPLAAMLMVGPVQAEGVGVSLECPAETGFGYIRDDHGTGDKITLTEICIDRDSGTFDGALSHGGFELVMDDGVSQTYEDLAASTGPIRPTMQIAPVLVSTYHGGIVEDNSPEVNVFADDQWFVGFLYDELSGNGALAEEFAVLVSAHPYGLQGTASFSEGAARFDLFDSPMFGTSKNGSGTLELVVDADGVVSGEGNFLTENIRTAGYQADEWVSETVEITELKGYSVGNTGQVIKVFAIAEATTTDAEGDVRTNPKLLEIMLLDNELLKMMGNQ